MDNSLLNHLLDVHAENCSAENYKNVLDEILNGNSILLLPSINDTPNDGGWKLMEKGEILKLTSVFNLDGLKVLGAFTDENALMIWANKIIQYKAMRTQDVVTFCKGQGIDRIVINSNQKNIFVLERSRENLKSRTIEKETPTEIGMPKIPLNKNIIDKLIFNFKKIDTILEGYHYAQSMNNEFSLIIGILLSIVSDDSKAAVYNAINNSLQGEKLNTPVDILILTNDSTLNSVRNIKNSLFYKK